MIAFMEESFGYFLG